MARKHNEENERIKRQYMQFLREAKRHDMTTVDKGVCCRTVLNPTLSSFRPPVLPCE